MLTALNGKSFKIVDCGFFFFILVVEEVKREGKVTSEGWHPMEKAAVGCGHV